MPNLVDIVEVAEALESKAVYLASDRCVVVRNRHASCAKCSDACPTGSVFAADNVLELDAEGCVACGACTTVCPVEALIPLRPLDEDLASSVAAGVAATDGQAVFACARIASKRLADPAKFAEVPCLARMEESVLLGLAARGVSDIVLVDGTCATCKFRANVPGIDATVASANELAPTGMIMNSWKSTLLSACTPPLRMFIIGVGSRCAFTPPTYLYSGSSADSAAALAQASDAPRMAFAPSAPLLSVPSTCSMMSSMKRWSSASTPMSASAISSFTWATASSVPLPR